MKIKRRRKGRAKINKKIKRFVVSAGVRERLTR
jgi:hypothetical protein